VKNPLQGTESESPVNAGVFPGVGYRGVLGDFRLELGAVTNKKSESNGGADDEQQSEKRKFKL